MRFAREERIRDGRRHRVWHLIMRAASAIWQAQWLLRKMGHVRGHIKSRSLAHRAAGRFAAVLDRALNLFLLPLELFRRRLERFGRRFERLGNVILVSVERRDRRMHALW